jgi:hypothetical protein
VNGQERGRTEAGGGPFEVVAVLSGATTEPFDVEIVFDKPAAKTARDDRELAFVLIELRARHARGDRGSRKAWFS